jgi:hypothetical protein
VNARSALECGGPPPLFSTTDLVCPAESAKGLAQSKICRMALAFCLLTCRGRDAGCPAPPSQIPACSIPAPGSST